jgi:hypothetical protein
MATLLFSFWGNLFNYLKSAFNWFAFIADLALMLPHEAIASSLFVLMTIVVFHEIYFSQLQFRGIVESVLSSNVILHELSYDSVKKIALKSLEKISGDRDLAYGVLGVLDESTGSSQRMKRYDHHVDIKLREGSSSNPIVDHFYFECFIQHTYKAVLSQEEFIFRLVDNDETYNKMVDSPDLEWLWFESKNWINELDPSFYCVQQLTIDGTEIQINQLNDESGTYYLAQLDKQLLNGKKREISYFISCKVQKVGHFLNLDFAKSTKGIKISLDYENCGIYHMNFYDSLSSGKRVKPNISRLPRNTSPFKLTFELNDSWIFPKSGISFGWMLESERKMFYTNALKKNPDQKQLIQLNYNNPKLANNDDEA